MFASFVFALLPSRAHPFRRAALLCLGLMSVLAALPINPQGPFDARDGSIPQGMKLEFPLAGAIGEPVAAPLHILLGSPDFRKTRDASVVWVTVLAFVAGWRSAPTRTRFKFLARTGRALACASLTLGFLLLWLATAVMLRLPGWRLVVDDPMAVITDLHSHTCGSRDGLVTAAESLACHMAAGFNVVAITEHGYPAAAYEAQRQALATPGAPAVIVGEEFSFNRGGAFFVALGLKPAYLYPSGLSKKDFVSRFSTYLHEAHGGALLGLGFKLDEGEIGMLLKAGADGFELANAGHPAIPHPIRERMLGMAREQGLSLVASSDWHGWGGIWRTWTVLPGTAAAQKDPQERAELVIRKLRERNGQDIIPVTAGYMGPPPLWRVISAPVVEVLRYAAELSLPRVLSWWFWSALLFTLYQALHAKFPRPRALLSAVLLVAMGAVFFISAARLSTLQPSGLLVSAFPQRVALLCGGLCVLAWGAAAVLIRSQKPWTASASSLGWKA